MDISSLRRYYQPHEPDHPSGGGSPGQTEGPTEVVATPVVQASEVFTLNDFPAWTYVERRQDFDKQVFLGLKTRT
jgi:hypothetical protein